MLAAGVQIQLFKWHLHCILNLERLTWKKETERGTLKWRTKLHQFSYNEIVSSRALLPPPKSLFKPSIMQFPANLTASERCDFHLKQERNNVIFLWNKTENTILWGHCTNCEIPNGLTWQHHKTILSQAFTGFILNQRTAKTKVPFLFFILMKTFVTRRHICLSNVWVKREITAWD